MNFVKELQNKTVSISDFNKGMAGKIFNDVKKTGIKIVLKNNSADCILISPEDYNSLLEEIENARDIIEANRRLEEVSKKEYLSREDFEKEFDIDLSKVDAISDDELE